RCGLFDRGSLGFGLFTLFIRAVQKTLDQAGTALLRDLRPLGLLLVLEDFVISRVAHGIPPSAEHTNSRATQQYGLCSNLTIAVPILYARMGAFGESGICANLASSCLCSEYKSSMDCCGNCTHYFNGFCNQSKRERNHDDWCPNYERRGTSE